MDPVRITFPAPTTYRPWSVNELTNTRQGNAIRTKQKHAWRDAMIEAIEDAPFDTSKLPSPANVKVHIPFRTNARRDPHNYVGTVVKVLVDAMVKFGGFWPDDNPTYLTVIDPVLYKGTDVIVEITERTE